jgi:hypothetical protein
MCAVSMNMTDDVVIHGKTEQDHQRALLFVLKRREDSGLILNLEKCEIKFYGLRFTKDCVSPADDRVRKL